MSEPPTITSPTSRRGNTETISVASASADYLRHLEDLRTRFTHTVFGSNSKVAVDSWRDRSSTTIQSVNTFRVCGLKIPTLRPDSNFRLSWDVLAICCGITNALLVPLVAAFQIEKTLNAVFGISLFVDIFFLVDMFLNAITGFYDIEGDLVTKPSEIWKNYRRVPDGSLWLDLIANIPLDYAYLIAEGHTQGFANSKLIRFSRVLKLLRLLRLVSLQRYIARMEKRFHVNWMAMRIVKIALLVLLFVHWLGCFFYLQAVLHDFSPLTWVYRDNLQGASVIRLYSYCIMSVMAQIATCGYAVYPSSGPMLVSEQVLICISLIVGTVSFIHLTGSFLALTMSLDPAGIAFTGKVYEIGRFMSYANVPADLRLRVRDYFGKKYEKQLFDEDSVLGDMSEPLQRDVARYNARAVLEAVSVFRDARPGLLNTLLSLLKSSFLVAGDPVLVEHEPASRVYFIASGTVSVSRGGTMLATLSTGSYFGDIAVVMGTLEPVTVAPLTDCRTFYVQQEDWATLVSEFPDVGNVFETVAKHRMKLWNLK